MASASARIAYTRLLDKRFDKELTTAPVHDAQVGAASITRTLALVTNATSNEINASLTVPGVGYYMSRRVGVTGCIPFTITFNKPDSDGSFVPIFGRTFSVCALPFNTLVNVAQTGVNQASFTTQHALALPYIKRALQGSESTAYEGVPTTVSECAYTLDSVTERDQVVYGPDGSNSRANITWEWRTSDWNSPLGVQPEINSSSTNLSFNGYLYIRDEPLLVQPFLAEDDGTYFNQVIAGSIRLSLLNAADAHILRFATRSSVDVNAGPPASLVAENRGSVARIVIPPDQAAAEFKKFQFASIFLTPPAGYVPPIQPVFPTTQYTPHISAGQLSETLSSWRSQTAVDPDQRQRSRFTSLVHNMNVCPDALVIMALPQWPLNTPDGQPVPATGVTFGEGAAGAYLGDPMLPIRRISLRWNNNSNLLVNLTGDDLWRRTRQNGLHVRKCVFDGAFPLTASSQGGTVYNSEWLTWTQGQINALTANGQGLRGLPGAGSPILLLPGKDIPMEPGVGAGSAGVYTLQADVDVINNLDVDVSSITLVILAINSQYLKLAMGGTSELVTSIVSEQEAAMAPIRGNQQDKLEMPEQARALEYATAAGRSGFTLARQLLGRGATGMAYAAGPDGASDPNINDERGAGAYVKRQRVG